MKASQSVAQGGIAHAEREPAKPEGHENDVEHDPLRVAGPVPESAIADRKSMTGVNAAHRNFIGAKRRAAC
jgi:hypothetical protein